MWHNYTARYVCVHPSFKHIGEYPGLPAVHHTNILRENETRKKTKIDNFTIYAKTESHLLEYFEICFKICGTHQLYLTAKKIRTIYKTGQMVWRIISSDGFRSNSRNIGAIKTVEHPINFIESFQSAYC